MTEGVGKFSRVFSLRERLFDVQRVRMAATTDGGMILSLSMEALPFPEVAGSEGEDEAQDMEDGDFPEVIGQLWNEVREYLDGSRKIFSVPYGYSPSLRATAFQDTVWRELEAIPYGERVTYSELSRRLGKPGAARAVGHALHRNPHQLLRPCHRVVAADGLGGFAAGPSLKRLLLSIEFR